MDLFDDPSDGDPSDGDPVDEWDHANDPGEDDADIDAAWRQTVDDSSRRAAASTLSALSAQVSAYPVISDPDEQQRLINVYLAGMSAQLSLAEATRINPDNAAGDTVHADPAQAEEWRRAIIAGNDAGNRLTASMFRLTRKIAMEQATRRFGRARAMDMLDDLISEAHVALVGAFTTYDPKRCPTFALYAGKVVRTTITNRMQESTENAYIKPPSSWLRTKRWALPLLAEKTEEYGRPLTDTEITAVLTDAAMVWAYERLTDAQKALPEEQRKKIMHAKLIKQGTVGAIRHWGVIAQHSGSALSLDATFGGDDYDRTMHEVIAEPDGGSDFDAAELSALHRDLIAALDQFGERDKSIVLHRFGFVDGKYWTFAELEPKFGISAERIRQIEQKVLSSLAGPGFTHLSLYLPGREDDGDNTGGANPTGDGSGTPGAPGAPGGPRRPRGP